MAVTPNLNLYLSNEDDYVSNERDLNDNFEKIDTAVGAVQTLSSRKCVSYIVAPNSSEQLPFAPNITTVYWYNSLDSIIPTAVVGHDGNAWNICDKTGNLIGTIKINGTTVTNSTNLHLLLIMSE